VSKKEDGLSRRDFLKATTKTGVGLAAFGGISRASEPEGADGKGVPAQSSGESAGKIKGTWPQEYSVHKDEATGHLTFSTRYYTVQHDLKRGGAIARISYTHGKASNLLLEPIGASIELAAKKAAQPIRRPQNFPSPQIFSDLHDSSPTVSVTQQGKWRTANIETVLRTASGRDIGVRTRTAYTYRWGYIKIHKEYIFPQEGIKTSNLTVFSTVFDPSLYSYGYKPSVFEDFQVRPFAWEEIRAWGKIRSGTDFDLSYQSRYVPRYLVLANPGIEGIEWFVSDDLAQWDYQMTGEPGTSYANLHPRTQPEGITASINPLALPSNPNLARGGFVTLKGSFSFDYYVGMPILEGHAHKRWLERSYGANRGKWVSDDDIRRNAEHGIVTMTLHNDGDVNGDGLFWRDGMYPPYPPGQMKKMEHVIETCHKYGIKTVPYFSNHELNQSTKAFKEHGEEWGRKPDDQGNLRPNYYYGAHMCLKSGWKDYFKSYVDTVLKHQNFDGVYYDWNLALYCNNPLHEGKTTNGVTGKKGLASYAFSPTGHWDVDELLEVVEWSRERVGPNGLLMLHTTLAPMFATENFADYVVGMEFGYGEISTAMPKPNQLPLEWNFGGARSRADIEYGTIAKDAPPRIRRLFYLTALMTGTAPWPASYEAADLFGILKPLGDPEQYQFDDWRNHAVELAGRNCLSAIYSRHGQAYILLANLRPKSRAVRCRVNTRALSSPLASLSSASMVNQGASTPLSVDALTGPGEKIVLPADGVKLLHLKG